MVETQNNFFHQVPRFVCGPIMILPIGFSVAFYAAGLSNNGIGESHGIALFLDGSADAGGTSVFAATIAEYVVFGFLGAFYLCFELQHKPAPKCFLQHLTMCLSILQFHFIAFFIGGLSNTGYDDGRIFNDFRNMFLWALFIYLLSIIFIISLHRAKLAFLTRLILAPSIIFLWLFLGSDGNTPIAGQSRNSGDSPLPIIRSFRHGVMLQRHKLCNSLL